MGDKRDRSIMPLQIRERVLWFLNSQRNVTLALRDPKAEGQDVVQEEDQGEGEDLAINDLRWFLSELSKDIHKILQGHEDQEEGQLVPRTRARTGASTGRGAGPVPEDMEGIVDESLMLLRSDPGCKSAGYHPSKNQFSVVRTQDKKRKNFLAKQLKRKREAAASSDCKGMEEAFQKTVWEARAWMACEAGPAPVDGDPAHESDEEAQVASEEEPAPLPDGPVPLADVPAEESDEDAK